MMKQSLLRFLISIVYLVVAVLCSSAPVDDTCCDTLVIDHKRDELVYPLAWLPYIQNKIHFGIDAERDVIISLSKHTSAIDPRYLLVFQEDNTNKASIKKCHSNPPSFDNCEDEIYAPSSSPYLISGTRKYYWISETSEDYMYTIQIGREGEQEAFLSLTPKFSSEIGIKWIGLGAASDARVVWQFCDLVLNEVGRQKPSYQSSNLYEGVKTYDASRANGFNSSLQLPGYCSQTAIVDFEPWWRVDLQAEYNVKIVRLWNDMEDTSYLLEGVTVYVSSVPSFTNQKIREQSKLCGAGSVTKDEAKLDTVIVRSCDYNTGRYVYLIKTVPTLKLCGVEIFGYQDLDDSQSERQSCKDIASSSSGKAGNSSVLLPSVICIVLVFLIAGSVWLYFAYTHPSSSSGLFLLKISRCFRTGDNSSGPAAKYSLVSPSNV